MKKQPRKKRKYRVGIWLFLIVFVMAPATYVFSWNRVLFVTNAECIDDGAPCMVATNLKHNDMVVLTGNEAYSIRDSVVYAMSRGMLKRIGPFILQNKFSNGIKLDGKSENLSWTAVFHEDDKRIMFCIFRLKRTPIPKKFEDDIKSIARGTDGKTVVITK